MWELWGSTSSTACTNVTSSRAYCYYNGTATASTTSSYYQGLAQAQMYNRTTASAYQGMRNVYAYAESTEDWLARQRLIQAAQLEKHSQAARDRALNLLLSHLTPEQRATFEAKKWFIVEGGRSKRQYRIHANDNVAANIEVLDLDGRRTLSRLCGHCNITKVPLGDHVLAQKIMLESDEDAFLRIANRHAA